MPSPRTVSLAFVALLLVGPWAGVAQAQDDLLPGVIFDIEVEPGAVQLIHNSKVTNFLSSNETFAISVTLDNYGTSSVTGVPVFWWFGTQRGCMKSGAVPARQSLEDPGVGWANMTQVLLDWQLPNTTGYNVVVSVNERPPASVADNFPNHCNGSSYNPLAETELRNPDEVDNVAWGYFVKDKRLDLNVTRVDWCRPNGDECLLDMWSTELGDWYNSTAYDERLTFFNITIANDGEWRYMVDNSSADCERDEGSPYTPVNCPNFGYDIEARLFGPGLAATGMLLAVDTTGATTDERWAYANYTSWGTEDFDLEGRAGNYTLTVSVDPTGRVRQSATNDQREIPVQVRHVELRPFINVTEFRTDAQDPYPFAAGTRINGSVAFLNEGIMNLTAGRDVDARVYIDDPDGAFAKTATFQRNAGTAGQLNTAKVYEWLNVTAADGWTLSTDEESPYYLAPGSHKLIAEIDLDDEDNYLELNETDNRTEVTIYVQDTGAPRFWTNRTNPLVRPSTDITNAENAESILDLHPGQNFTVRAFAEDTEPVLTVTANFTLKTDANVSQRFTLGPLSSGSKFYSTAAIRNFTMNDTNASSEEWSLVVEARDTTGNVAKTTPVTVTFRQWPIQAAPTGYWILEAEPTGMPDNATYAWSDDVHNLDVHIRIPNNMTGWDQHNYTANLWMHVDPPGDDVTGRQRTYAGAEGWAHPRGQQDVCAAPSAREDDGIIGGIGTDPENPTDPCPDYGEFVFSMRKYDGRPGVWNYSIVVRDISGVNRTVNRTVTFLDEAPQIRRYTLEKEKIEAGVEPANLTVEWVEDFNVSQVYMNVSLGERNITSVPLTKSGTGSDGSLERTWWNTSLATGRGTLLGIAGNFTTRVAAVDVNGNWGLSPTRTLEIVDSRAPTIGAFGVTPPAQEIGGNVTFHAYVSDQSNVTAVVRLFHDGEEVWNASLASTDGENFAVTRNFTEEETYTWEIQAFDGNLPTGIASDVKRGTLIVSENLGPRYDVLAPSFTSGGERFGKAAQRVSVLVYDNDGVDRDSLNFTVDGVEITGSDLRVDPAPAGYVGWTLSYAIPSSAGYGHNDTITIGLSAVDLSNRSLASDDAFSFRVDDEAPTSRLARLEPRFRVNESDPWTISLASRFEFAATDNDGMPTGVQTIRYAVIGGTSGSDVETVYTGPFTIDSVAESYTGPRAYLVEYWAEDEVGNVESPIQRVPVTVDVQAPTIDIYGSLPSGQFVNITIQDHQAGVRDVVAWYSLNGSPSQPISLEPTGDTWRGVLPEGRKGERMTYYLQAWDNVNNTAKFGNETEPYSAYTVGNHLPELRITSPTAGARVSKMLDLRWSAEDEDGEDLTFVVYLKAPGRSNFVELSRIAATGSRSYQLDTTRYADGEYTLAVTASDGSFVARAETAVVFLNSARPVGNVTAPGSVTPGEGVLITAEVTKAGASVEARLIRDGELVDAFTMNDDGRDGDVVPGDGIYSVEVALDRSGDYSIEIVTRYQENGEEVESKVQGPAFTVRLTPGAILSEYAVLWVTLVVLVLGAVGVAGFALYRKWR